MSDLKKIKEEFLLKLNKKLDVSEINEIKSSLFGKNGLVSSQFKKIGSLAESERKKFASDLNIIKDELQDIIKEYLSGENVSNISKGLYRSPAFVKSILERIGVPQRPVSVEDRKAPMYLPEECVADNFEEGEIVWSAVNHAPAVIERKYTKEYQDSKPGLMTRDYEKTYGCSVFSIYIRQNRLAIWKTFILRLTLAGFIVMLLLMILAN